MNELLSSCENIYVLGTIPFTGGVLRPILVDPKLILDRYMCSLV